jgi:hypothetical protein
VFPSEAGERLDEAEDKFLFSVSDELFELLKRELNGEDSPLKVESKEDFELSLRRECFAYIRPMRSPTFVKKVFLFIGGSICCL